jgi:very-short-patch-repair endonuclease
MEPQLLIALLGTLAGLFLVARLIRWIGSRRKLPYRKVDSLLTPAERSFYAVLLRVAESEHRQVFAKVRLADLFWLPGDATDRLIHQNRINQKHIDFVLCDPRQLTPLLAVELDDSSHQRTDRQKRDAFVDEVCAVAGLPLLRVPVQSRYDERELTALIRQALKRATTANWAVSAGGGTREKLGAPVVVEESSSNGLALPVGSGSPTPCPKCGDVLVERSSGRTGQRFLACRNHPACRHTRLLPNQVSTTKQSR